MKQRITVATRVLGIDSLPAPIQTNDEEVEVHAKTYTVGHGKLLVELIELKLAPGLLFVISEGPDVASVNKGCPTKLPEETRAILDIGIELDVARLIQEVVVGTLKASWTKFTHRPSSHAVGATREVTFLEWKHPGIAVGHSNTCSKVKNQGIALVNLQVTGQIKVHLDILSEGNVEQGIFPIGIPVHPRDASQAIKQVAR